MLLVKLYNHAFNSCKLVTQFPYTYAQDNTKGFPATYKYSEVVDMPLFPPFSWPYPSQASPADVPRPT